MITAEQSVPVRSASAAVGLAVVWQQFNDITVYVEDAGKEYFYNVIVRKILPGKKIRKIIPTGGKPNSLRLASKYAAESSYAFIVDLDFDDLLSGRSSLPNVFYLDRYSIENYLIEEAALLEYMRESRPDIHPAKALSVIRSLWRQHIHLLRIVTQCCILIQKRSLGLHYYNIDPARDSGFRKSSANPAHRPFVSFMSDVEASLQTQDRRCTLQGSLRGLRKHTKTAELLERNALGKQLVAIAKFRIERDLRVPQATIESFTYRLAKNCTFAPLIPLGQRIIRYSATPSVPSGRPS